eukprot:TRINITY_DN9766_c0_g1_i4.p1 TRINITY_DN9766_c0_g1~~TRINITY_DN9766_c0_g1_i4.p1  ORF type:complete len:414 (+),score=69.78 TRINITY_DN9766_c0_g1_i4:55-1242(+)
MPHSPGETRRSRGGGRRSGASRRGPRGDGGGSGAGTPTKPSASPGHWDGSIPTPSYTTSAPPFAHSPYQLANFDASFGDQVQMDPTSNFAFSPFLQPEVLSPAFQPLLAFPTQPTDGFNMPIASDIPAPVAYPFSDVFTPDPYAPASNLQSPARRGLDIVNPHTGETLNASSDVLDEGRPRPKAIAIVDPRTRLSAAAAPFKASSVPNPSAKPFHPPSSSPAASPTRPTMSATAAPFRSARLSSITQESATRTDRQPSPGTESSPGPSDEERETESSGGSCSCSFGSPSSVGQHRHVYTEEALRHIRSWDLPVTPTLNNPLLAEIFVASPATYISQPHPLIVDGSEIECAEPPSPSTPSTAELKRSATPFLPFSSSPPYSHFLNNLSFILPLITP